MFPTTTLWKEGHNLIKQPFWCWTALGNRKYFSWPTFAFLEQLIPFLLDLLKYSLFKMHTEQIWNSNSMTYTMLAIWPFVKRSTSSNLAYQWIYHKESKITLLVLRLKAIIFMVEPLIHLSFQHPFLNCSWQDILEHGAKPGVDHHVPGIAIVRDTAEDPGTLPGAEKHLASKKKDSLC